MHNTQSIAMHIIMLDFDWHTCKSLLYIKAWWSLIHAVAAMITKLLLWGQLYWRKWVEIYCACKMPHCIPLILIHILQLSSTLVLGLQMSMLLGLHHWLQADKLKNVITLTVFYYKNTFKTISLKFFFFRQRRFLSIRCLLTCICLMVFWWERSRCTALMWWQFHEMFYLIFL